MRNFKNQGLSGNLDNGRQPASGRLTRSTGAASAPSIRVRHSDGFPRDTVKLRRAGRPVVSR